MTEHRLSGPLRRARHLKCVCMKHFQPSKSAYPGFVDFTYSKSSDTLEKNCNISSLLLKLTDMTSNQESVYMKTLAQIPGLTSQKSLKIKFSTDKICYNFSHEHPKISNM